MTTPTVTVAHTHLLPWARGNLRREMTPLNPPPSLPFHPTQPHHPPPHYTKDKVSNVKARPKAVLSNVTARPKTALSTRQKPQQSQQFPRQASTPYSADTAQRLARHYKNAGKRPVSVTEPVAGSTRRKSEQNSSPGTPSATPAGTQKGLER